MTTIIKTVEIDTPADAVWDAVADFGAVHTRFAPGFVTNVELVDGDRMVTFANALVVKELFLGCDHAARRLAYSVQSDRFTHHSASFVVQDIGQGRSRLVWTADVLPHAAAEGLAPMMEQGIAVAKATLDRIAA